MAHEPHLRGPLGVGIRPGPGPGPADPRAGNDRYPRPGPRHGEFPQRCLHSGQGPRVPRDLPHRVLRLEQGLAPDLSVDFLLRYGLTDNLEFRIFSKGLTAQAARGKQPATTGFSPLAFDFKANFW